MTDAEELRQVRGVGALTDQVSARHLYYRRSLEHLQVTLQQQLAWVQASAGDPSQRIPDVLPAALVRVKEARAVYDAAAEALRQHRATH